MRFFENFFELFCFFDFPEVTVLLAFCLSYVNTVSGVSVFSAGSGIFRREKNIFDISIIF